MRFPICAREADRRFQLQGLYDCRDRESQLWDFRSAGKRPTVGSYFRACTTVAIGNPSYGIPDLSAKESAAAAAEPQPVEAILDEPVQAALNPGVDEIG